MPTPLREIRELGVCMRTKYNERSEARPTLPLLSPLRHFKHESCMYGFQVPWSLPPPCVFSSCGLKPFLTEFSPEGQPPNISPHFPATHPALVAEPPRIASYYWRELSQLGHSLQVPRPAGWYALRLLRPASIAFVARGPSHGGGDIEEPPQSQGSIILQAKRVCCCATTHPWPKRQLITLLNPRALHSVKSWIAPRHQRGRPRRPLGSRRGAPAPRGPSRA